MGHCIWGIPFAHGGWLLGHGPLAMLAHLLLTFIVVLVLLRIVRALLSRDGARRDTRDSLEILKARLARGEITEEQYRRLHDILRR